MEAIVGNVQVYLAKSVAAAANLEQQQAKQALEV